MSGFSETLKKLRDGKGMSQEEFAALVGTSKQNISRYESGEVSPKISTAALMAKKLGVTLSELNGEYNNSLIPRQRLQVRRVPILGDTAAGEPIIANREYDEFVDVPDDGHHRYDAALRVAGDSMMPLYHKDDLVFIRYQDDVRDGQIAAVGLGDTVTLKRVYHIPNGVQLISENRDYPAQTYTADDVGSIHICGLAVGVLHFD